MKTKTKQVPIWAWIVIVILAILLVYYYFQSSENLNLYYGCASEYADSVLDYGNLGEDYLQLLVCYRDNLPSCDFLNEKYPEAKVRILK